MKVKNSLLLALSLGLSTVWVMAQERVEVVFSENTPLPSRNATNVDPRMAVRVEFSQAVHQETINSQTFRLLDSDGQQVLANVNTDLTGGVATLTPVNILKPESVYKVELNAGIAAAGNRIFNATEWSFTTGKLPVASEDFFCEAVELEQRNQITTLTVGPDDQLYVADVHGLIKRYLLDEEGHFSGAEEVTRIDGQQIIHMVFDPDASVDNLVLWVSHAKRDAGIWAGKISKVSFPIRRSEGEADVVDVIVGLPCPETLDHQPNGLAFSPDGILYQTVGGVATLGGSPNWGAEESLLSAAIIKADVKNPAFNGGVLPCNVQIAGPVNYDPYALNAPVQIVATGLRNALGLCFHSTGHLFSATNGNSWRAGATTPAKDDIPAITYTPHEALMRIVPGKYYGHPNPAREEYVLLGGNPTEDKDPWEVPMYPVGTMPEPNFDPTLLYDIREGGGNSANGMEEYRGSGISGPLENRLLIAYFSGGRGVQTFNIGHDGRIIHEHPLTNDKGEPLRFNQPLDIAVHPLTGRIYVAVFGNWDGGVRSSGGGIWMVTPLNNSN